MRFACLQVFTDRIKDHHEHDPREKIGNDVNTRSVLMVEYDPLPDQGVPGEGRVDGVRGRFDKGKGYEESAVLMGRKDDFPVAQAVGVIRQDVREAFDRALGLSLALGLGVAGLVGSGLIDTDRAGRRLTGCELAGRGPGASDLVGCGLAGRGGLAIPFEEMDGIKVKAGAKEYALRLVAAIFKRDFQHGLIIDQIGRDKMLEFFSVFDRPGEKRKLLFCYRLCRGKINKGACRYIIYNACSGQVDSRWSGKGLRLYSLSC